MTDIKIDKKEMLSRISMGRNAQRELNMVGGIITHLKQNAIDRLLESNVPVEEIMECRARAQVLGDIMNALLNVIETAESAKYSIDNFEQE